MKMYLVLGILSIYLIVVVFFYLYQKTFLYFPNEDNYLTSEVINIDNKIVRVETSDKIILESYLYINKKNAQTILFLHGNAGTLESRIYKLNKFKEIGLNYLAITWRGFSGNKGEPSEYGLTLDGISGLNYLNSLGITDKNIIIYGESLGTGVAVNLAQLRKVSGLILESPYTSIANVGKIKFPFLPVNFILKDKFNSLSKIENIKCPILVMHGFNDPIVPFSMGKELFEKIKSEKYSFFTTDDHMMRFSPELIKSISNLLKVLKPE